MSCSTGLWGIARKLAPADVWLLDQHIDLLITLGRLPEARALLGQSPANEIFPGLAREANIDLGVPNIALADYKAPENYPAADCPLCAEKMPITRF